MSIDAEKQVYLGEKAPQVVAVAVKTLEKPDRGLVCELLQVSKEAAHVLQGAGPEAIVGLAIVEAALRLLDRRGFTQITRGLERAGVVEVDLAEYRRWKEKREDLEKKIEAVLDLIKAEAPRYGLRQSSFEIRVKDQLATATRLEDLKRRELREATVADRVIAFITGFVYNSAWTRVVLKALLREDAHRVFELAPGVCGNLFGVSPPFFKSSGKVIIALLEDYAERGFLKITIEKVGDRYKIVVHKEGENLAAEVSVLKSDRYGEFAIARLRGPAVKALAIEEHLSETEGEALRKYFRGLGGWLASDISFSKVVNRPRVDTTSYTQKEIFRAMGFTMWTRDVGNITKYGVKPYYSGDAVKDSPIWTYLQYLEKRIKDFRESGLPNAKAVRSLALEKIYAYKQSLKPAQYRQMRHHLARLEYAIHQITNGVVAGEANREKTALCIHSCSKHRLTLPMLEMDLKKHWAYARHIYPLLDTVDMSPPEYAYFLLNNILGDGYVRKYDVTIVAGDFKGVKNNLPLNIYHKAALYILSLATHGVSIHRIRFREKRDKPKLGSIEITVKAHDVQKHLNTAWDIYYGAVYEAAKRVYQKLGIREALKDHIFQKMDTIKHLISQNEEREAKSF